MLKYGLYSGNHYSPEATCLAQNKREAEKIFRELAKRFGLLGDNVKRIEDDDA
jgi:hypothetical protein